MTTSFQRAYPPARPAPGEAYWLLFQESRLVVQESKAGIALPRGEEEALTALLGEAPLYIGTLEGVAYLAGEIAAERPLPTGWRPEELRGLFGRLDERVYGLVGYAWQILCWRREHRYCPRCGHLLGELFAQWARECPNCGNIVYPPVTPAILVLIHDGERILLARNAAWAERYSVLAGFVEPGESLEECVQREIAEEVGLSVTDITYVKSQPWPFPHQLMVGFTARYAGGEIHVDPTEIAHAAWFTADTLPAALPGGASLARQLIDGWLQEHRKSRD